MAEARRSAFWVSIILLALLLGWQDGGRAEDWPHWRGPARNGISRETDWDHNKLVDGPDVLWQQQVGTGFSSAAVVDGRLYTMGNTGRRGQRDPDVTRDTVWCFDAVTGRQVWRQTYPAPLDPRSYEGGPSATPAVEAGRVYTLGKRGQVCCLDAVTGSVIWQVHLDDDYERKPPRWGFAGSPVIVGNLIVLNAGRYGLALAKRDGSLAWTNEPGLAGYSSAVPYEWQRKVCITMLGGKEVYGLEAGTGCLLWAHPWETKHDENIPDPIVAGDKLFVSTALGSGAALYRMGTDGLSVLWRHKELQTWLNTAVLWQGHLYGVDSGKARALVCLKFETGDVTWTGPAAGNGGLMLADGKLIALTETGRLLVAKAVPSGYQELASAQILDGKCWTAPVLANGCIYARNAQGDLVCIDVRRQP
jgi:outer membrane protein assembly factor BamB